MDTSETYIKMCDCPEIQGLRPFRDDYYCESRSEIVYSRNNVMYVEGERCIWLPRQDQLQEMVTVSHKEDYNRSMYPILEKLWEFSCTLYLIKYPPTSMEQLWLAFVMKEKYNKTWDGEKWYA